MDKLHRGDQAYWDSDTYDIDPYEDAYWKSLFGSELKDHDFACDVDHGQIYVPYEWVNAYGTDTDIDD